MKLPEQVLKMNTQADCGDEREQFLRLRRYPAITHAEEAGWILSLSTAQVAKLTSKGHLQALGAVGPGDWKRYAAIYIRALSTDKAWLERAQQILQDRHS